MRISELIHESKKILDKHGDIEVQAQDYDALNEEEGFRDICIDVKTPYLDYLDDKEYMIV